MAEQLELTADGARALQEAQNFCWRANVAIVAAEHVLAGALLVLGEAKFPGVPSHEQLEAALETSQALGEGSLSNNVMFGSGARDAINTMAANVRQAGGATIDARQLAVGVIESGEVNPMFYGALGVTKGELLTALSPQG